MIRNLQTRLILFIIFIATFAGCFSFLLSFFFYGSSLENNIKQNQTKIAENILLLHQETDFPLEKIISIDFSNEYELKVVNDISNYKNITKDNDIIYSEKPLLHSVTTIVKIEDSYIYYSKE